MLQTVLSVTYEPLCTVRPPMGARDLLGTEHVQKDPFQHLFSPYKQSFSLCFKEPRKHDGGVLSDQCT